MARKRRKSSSGSNAGGLILGILVTAFVLLIMFGSVLLFVIWIIQEKSAKSRTKPKSLDFFAHTKDEINSIRNKERQLNMVFAGLERIEIEGKTLARRQDGQFNERSVKGKQFNAEVIKLNADADQLESSLNELESRPATRLHNWLFTASMHMGLRHAVLGYLASFALFAWLQPAWILQLSTKLQSYSFLDFYASYPVAYGASTGAFVASMIVLTVSYFYTKQKLLNQLQNGSDTGTTEQVDESSLEVNDMMSFISQVSHAHLKSAVEAMSIPADKRSKATIITAINQQNQQTIGDVYSFLKTVS